MAADPETTPPEPASRPRVFVTPHGGERQEAPVAWDAQKQVWLVTTGSGIREILP